MQFFIDSQGTVVNLISSPVYQGSTNACELVLVAPFSSANQITACFKLPNGITTEPYIMTVQAQPMQIEGKTYNVWRVLLDGAITEYAGQVTVQFSVYQNGFTTNNGNMYNPIKPTTYASTFTVQRGVTPTLPETPSQNIYENILLYLSQLNPQYNIESVSYSSPGNEIDTDTEVSSLTRIPADSILKTTDVNFSIENIDGSQNARLYALGENLQQDTGITITFAEPQAIGKMQLNLSGAYFLTNLVVNATLEDGTVKEVGNFNFLAPSPISVIINVRETVNAISIVQPYESNVAIDENFENIGDKGFTNGRFYIDSIDMWKPNTNGQITITSSTGRTIVFPDTDAEAYATIAQNASEQAQASEQSASNSASQATSALDEILSKAGQVGGYPILADIDGQPKIPSVYIQQVDIKDYIQITNESELATITAQVGDVAVLVSTVDGETTVTKSWILLSITDNTRNWAVYGTSYASNAGNALFSQNSADSQKVNGLTINGVLSEADYNALASKQGVYFVSIEGETNGN